MVSIGAHFIVARKELSSHGYGQSAPALLTACNIQKPVLLGHSDGASIAPLYASFDITEKCSRITCPLLAIQGYDDAYGTMAQIDALNKKGEVKQLLKLKQCGHSPHKDQADTMLASVVRFLKTVES